LQNIVVGYVNIAIVYMYIRVVSSYEKEKIREFHKRIITRAV